jgi:hypothetical protein
VPVADAVITSPGPSIAPFNSTSRIESPAAREYADRIRPAVTGTVAPALPTETVTGTAVADVLHKVTVAILAADICAAVPDGHVYWVVSPFSTNFDTKTCGKLLVATKRF